MAKQRCDFCSPGSSTRDWSVRIVHIWMNSFTVRSQLVSDTWHEKELPQNPMYACLFLTVPGNDLWDLLDHNRRPHEPQFANEQQRHQVPLNVYFRHLTIRSHWLICSHQSLDNVHTFPVVVFHLFIIVVICVIKNGIPVHFPISIHSACNRSSATLLSLKTFNFKKCRLVVSNILIMERFNL